MAGGADVENGLHTHEAGNVIRAASAELLLEAETEMPAEEIAAVNELESLVVADGVVVGYGSVGSGSGSGSPGVDGDENVKQQKKKRKQAKAVIDLLKIDMASERTFFKWFRTGMQIGAVGTFVFLALDPGTGGQTVLGMVTVGFTWVVGFALVLYGLYEFKSRRRAVRAGASDAGPLREWAREHAPTMVVVALVLVVGAGLLYAALLGEVPSKHRHGVK